MISVEKLHALETAARREQARVVGSAIVTALRVAGRRVLRLFAGGESQPGVPVLSHPANRNHDNRAAA